MVKLKSKYEALNYLNEKYDAYCCEVTCYQEAKEFWDNLITLWRVGKISDSDITLGEKAMNMF